MYYTCSLHIKVNTHTYTHTLLLVVSPTGVAMVPSHEGGVFTLGRAGSVLCSSDLSGAEVNWRSSISDDVIVSGNELQFPVVSESVNGREYGCHVTTQYGSLEDEYRVIVEGERGLGWSWVCVVVCVCVCVYCIYGTSLYACVCVCVCTRMSQYV